MSETTWVKTRTDVDTVSWDEKPIHLRDVPAVKDTKTGKVWVYPADVARVELEELARKHGLEPRDIPILLTLKAQAGGFFNKEEVQFQYHVNKILWYELKGMEEIGLGETFPHDEFVKADRGPMPKNIDGDIDRLSKIGLISTELRRWGSRPRDESRRIFLTNQGSKLVDSLLSKIPAPLLKTTTEAKTKIAPLLPSSVKDMVHRDYPEYRTTYVKEDTA